jgi:hypothetical protein
MLKGFFLFIIFIFLIPLVIISQQNDFYMSESYYNKGICYYIEDMKNTDTMRYQTYNKTDTTDNRTIEEILDGNCNLFPLKSITLAITLINDKKKICGGIFKFYYDSLYYYSLIFCLDRMEYIEPFISNLENGMCESEDLWSIINNINLLKKSRKYSLYIIISGKPIPVPDADIKPDIQEFGNPDSE